MIKRIELINFMSHEHTVIEPAAGLTVLVGPNNCGKSAVVTALQILSHNDNSTYVKRHGERECSIIIETGDGHIIEWHRKDSPRYVINGKVFDRLKTGGQPEELNQVLRLPRVEAATREFDVHVGEQKSPIFLLEGGLQAAAFFASSSDAARLVEMQALHKQRVANAQREKKRLEAEAAQVNSELALLEPVVDLDLQLEQAEQGYADLQKLAARIVNAALAATDLIAQSGVVARRSMEANALLVLSAPPELTATEPLSLLVTALGNAQKSLAIVNARVNALTSLAVPPGPEQMQPLASLAEELNQAALAVAKGGAIRAALNPLADPPIADDTHPLEELARDYVVCRRLLEQRDAEQQILAPLTALPVFADTRPLSDFISTMRGAHLQVLQTAGRSESLDGLIAPPALQDEQPIANLLNLFRPAARNSALWEGIASVLASLELNPIAEATRPLEDAIAEMATTSALVATLDRRASDLTSELDESMVSLREWAARNPLCPTCGGAVDPDEVLARAMTGDGGCAHA